MSHQTVQSNSVVNDLSLAEKHDYQLITVLFAICGSFLLGFIPILFALGLDHSVPANADIQTQISPWSVVGEESY